MMIVIIFLVNSPLVTGISDYDDNQGSTVDGVIHSNPSAGNKIAITLDVDGSNLDMDLITLLIYNKIPITLFVNTKYLIANKETFLQLKSSHPDLVEFENHGAEHKACILGTEKVYGQEPAGTVEGMTKEIKDAADAIQNTLGVTTKYYRPGTGAADAACVETAKELGHSVVDWSVNGDHGAGDTAENVKANWLSVTSGGIIISHLNKPQGNTYEGAKEAITLLKKKGFTFVRLEDLLGTTGAAAIAIPSKGASLSTSVSDTVFDIDYGDSNIIQFKYDEAEKMWLVSAACELKEPIEESAGLESIPYDFVGINDFVSECSETDLNRMAVDEIFPSGTDTLEEGKENICGYYAKEVVDGTNPSLSIDGKKIILPTPIIGSEKEIRTTIEESCLNQIMAAEGSVAPEEIVEEHEDLSEIGEGIQEVEETAQAPNSQLCEIDSVWIATGTSLNIEKAVKTLIFTLTGWQPFDDVCKPKTPATAASTTPSGKKYAWSSQYDSIINNKLTAEMKDNGFDLNLIKALISHESAFHSQAISTAGCIGLMQICYTSVPSAAPAYQKTTCCEAGEDSPKQTCTSEVKKTKHLWQEGVYKCNPNNDDRFNPEKNIAMGLELLSKKYAQCNTVNGALSAYASGSCSNRLDYAETIQSIKKSHKNE